MKTLLFLNEIGLSSIITMIIGLGIGFIFFLLLREIFLWYLKINIIITELQKGNTELQKINENLKKLIEK
jgi:hypothetical protein